ncbi:uncharacterized protein RHOBADRAFT_25506 [Rhodotorula graminis WP1]|uniref:Uncharacterized protein n=1 Tax=Rhodotorula graminis (strain WP1) TaxID=578459 RepID=A0A194S7B3_RHOGW|nr:uncharacterized protein RHOBADRAFT_25506 [Rhodotorula graminis WP1]KPV76439.1 hypothetical protein RHOBADRAFT_25506 [Rhodotorula graminis WP1]
MSSSHLLASRLFSVKNLVAFVSGGGTGIGLMATQALAANGAKVYICGRRKEALDRVVEVYSPQVEGQIIALPGDVTNKDDIKRLAEEIRQREGGLHILVNNAGISGEVTKFDEEKPSAEVLSERLMKEQTFEGWNEVFQTNVSSMFFMTAAMLPLLAKFTNGGDAAGRAIYENFATGVINITSISGLVKVAQNHFAYNASKAAANHIQRMTATEFAHTGIRFNAIAPGVYPSEMTGSDSDSKNKTSLEGKFDPASLGVPAGRAGSEEDMAGTILYLSSRAGQYTNGAIIPVDGGTLLTNPSAY